MSQSESVFPAGEKVMARLLTKEEAAKDDRTYWHAKTPAERLAAAERLRQSVYGYDPRTGRIQPVAEIVELKDL
jgi:hypothetical protein